MNDNIATEVGYYGDTSIKVFGHNVYFRKEYTPDIEVKDDFDEVVGTIALPDHLRDISQTVQVLAVGDECGTVNEDRVKTKLHNWLPGIVNPIKPDDRLLLPGTCNTLTHPYGVRDEGLINEQDVIAIIYDDQQQED